MAHLTAGTWETENRIADIAIRHPRLVLDRPSNGNALRQLLRPPTYRDLRSALSDSPGQVADWILDGCKDTDPVGVALVLDKVVGERIPQAVIDHLIAAQQHLANMS